MSNGTDYGSTVTPQPDDVLARTSNDILADASFGAGWERGYKAGFKHGRDAGERTRCEREYQRGVRDGVNQTMAKLKKEKRLKTEKKKRSSPKGGK